MAADKFVLICTDLAEARVPTAIIDKVQAALRGPIALDKESVHLSASIGVAFYPQDSDNPETLIKYAELAMYQARDDGGNRHVVFTRELDTRVSERLGLQNRLREAIEAGELVVHYQPQVSALTGAICGMEALVRWQHPEYGLVFPARFIPFAEECGLIVPLGNWVLREACRQNRAWHDEGLSDFPMAVNLSVIQLQDGNMLGEVRRILDETGLEARFLELELTESQLMQNTEMLITTLGKIREMGVKIAIDDFGSGYSSLNYLKRLPADRLKVDYSFVRDIINDPASASICRAIIAIAHNLRMGVVAEGVETQAQATYLARHYCESLQGFLICRPAPAEEISALLRRREPLLNVSSDQSARRTLLLIDDEANVRNALRRALRGDGYRILEASGHAEAFDLLAKHPVGVILCDQRMPEMTGTELLRRVKDIYPESIRIVLSGYADLDTVTASVNQGAVFKFLMKPWENETLREILRDAFWHYELSQRMAANWYAAGEAGKQREPGGQGPTD
jgi:EAL domain-containing protein (putative c-di-GMP-specific phosphodiesterase class I)/ActR/RegA family two-component response regulator